MEVNDKGELLLSINRVADSCISDYTRYNGGWIKSVIGLDKSKTDGYSIIGDFIDSKITWVKPGLYIDNSIGGSRKNTQSVKTLFRLNSDGSSELIYTAPCNSRNWAVMMWDYIIKESSSSKDELEKEQITLLKRLKEIEEELAKL